MQEAWKLEDGELLRSRVGCFFLASPGGSGMRAGIKYYLSFEVPSLQQKVHLMWGGERSDSRRKEMKGRRGYMYERMCR